MNQEDKIKLEIFKKFFVWISSKKVNGNILNHYISSLLSFIVCLKNLNLSKVQQIIYYEDDNGIFWIDL